MTDRVELVAADLAAALDALCKLGLRVDMIMPADDPHVVELSGHGVEVRLVRSATPPMAAGTWRVGRAGMQYRDLVPGRVGGRFIASHIRIPEGGPVPDHVHHHAIRFQMIYCYKGWVRLVYEDQGEPFVMRGGDCVLQPPHIRHRVLECSPGLEVVEVSSPAVHPTLVDHDMHLPTRSFAPERDFGGQRFAWLQQHDFAAMARATNGLATLRVRDAVGRVEHRRELFFGFVLQGALAVDGHQQRAGDAFVVEHSAELTDGSADLVWLELIVG